MTVAYKGLFENNKSMAFSFNSESVSISDVYAYTVVLTWNSGSSIKGTFKLQASNDDTNWVDLPKSDFDVKEDDGTAIIQVNKAYYPYVRVNWNKTSGSLGYVNIRLSSKRGS